MKRTIKNLFSAPTDSRTGGARLGARMLPAPSGYQLQVTGSAPINYIQDYLCIYDGTDTSSPILFTQEDKDYNRTDNIKVLTSSSQN